MRCEPMPASRGRLPSDLTSARCTPSQLHLRADPRASSDWRLKSERIARAPHAHGLLGLGGWKIGSRSASSITWEGVTHHGPIWRGAAIELGLVHACCSEERVGCCLFQCFFPHWLPSHMHHLRNIDHCECESHLIFDFSNARAHQVVAWSLRSRFEIGFGVSKWGLAPKWFNNAGFSFWLVVNEDAGPRPHSCPHRN